MKKLHLVGFTPEQDGLVLSTRRGAKSGTFVVPVDDDLFEAMEEAGARREEDGGGGGSGRNQSALSVREVQARLRGGRSVEEVARAAGVESDWVERFAAPVWAEQALIAAEVRGLVFSKPRLGPSGAPLGRSVYRNLAAKGIVRTLEELDGSWSAYQQADGVWVVAFDFESRGRRLRAEWEYDPGEGRITARDRAASQLAYVPADGTEPAPAPSEGSPWGRKTAAAKRATAASQVAATSASSAASREAAERASERVAEVRRRQAERTAAEEQARQRRRPTATSRAARAGRSGRPASRSATKATSAGSSRSASRGRRAESSSAGDDRDPGPPRARRRPAAIDTDETLAVAPPGGDDAVDEPLGPEGEPAVVELQPPPEPRPDPGAVVAGPAPAPPGPTPSPPPPAAVLPPPPAAVLPPPPPPPSAPPPPEPAQAVPSPVPAPPPAAERPLRRPAWEPPAEPDWGDEVEAPPPMWQQPPAPVPPPPAPPAPAPALPAMPPMPPAAAAVPAAGPEPVAGTERVRLRPIRSPRHADPQPAAPPPAPTPVLGDDEVSEVTVIRPAAAAWDDLVDAPSHAAGQEPVPLPRWGPPPVEPPRAPAPLPPPPAPSRRSFRGRRGRAAAAPEPPQGLESLPPPPVPREPPPPAAGGERVQLWFDDLADPDRATPRFREGMAEPAAGNGLVLGPPDQRPEAAGPDPSATVAPPSPTPPAPPPAVRPAPPRRRSRPLRAR